MCVDCMSSCFSRDTARWEATGTVLVDAVPQRPERFVLLTPPSGVPPVQSCMLRLAGVPGDWGLAEMVTPIL